METRNINITFEKAIELYRSNNESLRDLALQAFSKEELMHDFRDITTFKKACNALGHNYDDVISKIDSIVKISRASAAMFKLNIIRKALNFGQDLHLAEDPEYTYTYYPYNPFVTEGSIYYDGKLNSGKIEIIGKIKSEGEEYYVLGGSTYQGEDEGLGYFNVHYGVGEANANVGFLGCATEDIAKHFSKYFGMLITEAKYADIVDFEIIEEKYKI